MVFLFGDCELDLDRRELRRADVVWPLEPKAFTVLVHLVMQRHRAVAKDELLATCWPNEFVTEAALTRCLKVIRQAVGDDGVRQHVIKTLRGHGYRFVAPMETLSPHLAAPALSNTAVAVTHIHPAVGPTIPHPGRPCLQCQTVNRATRQFCAACGQALWVPCPQCGFGNDPTERFCGGCGGDVAAPVPLPAGARMGPPQAYTPAHLAQRMRTTPLPSGERKPVTVLVAEVDGVRDLRRTADPAVVDEVLNQGFALAMAEVHRVEGFISQMAGQGLTALFGAPLACEDHVLRALHAALSIQHAFTGYAAELQQTLGVALALRLGVHTGPWVVSALSADLQLTSTAAETTLDVAIALPPLAPGGTIAVSGAIQEVAAGFFRFTALGRHPLSEGAAPVEVYTCDGLGPVTSRLAGALARQHTVLQGRHQELALLQACATRVRRGQGQVVCLVGDAGMGKSRVAYECQQRLADVRWLTMQALSYGQAMPYHAVLPLLRTVLGVVETEPPAQQYQMLQTRLAAVDPLLVADAPLLAHVLGVPLESEPLSALAPDAQRQRLQHACLRLLLAQAADTPLGLLVEDGHWLDPSSQELLDRLVAALARRPVFLLCTARPGFRHFWADHTYFHQVAIEPLTGDETHALLRDLLQPYDASPDLHAWLHARTGGNPFFVEELVRTLRAHALLTVQGAVYEVAPAARGTLPDSIQGLVQARLDRLPAAEKRLVQVAAVVGPAVPLRLLEVLAECPTEAVHHGLAHLQSTEFLDETGFGPDVVFTFKHALTQDAVYQSLLRSTRQQVHQRIAQVLAERFPETAETQPELLAQHYTAAGLHAQSLPYWQRALKRSANREAAASLEKGLEAVPHLPQNRATLEQAVDLRLALRSALLPSGDSGRLLACLREAETLAATLDDPRRLGQISRFLSHHFYQSGAYDQAIDAAHRALALATAGGDVVRQALANQSLGYAYYSQGVYRPAIDCFGQLVLSLDGAQRRELFGLANLPAVAARVYLASCHAELGTFAAGSILGEEGLQIAEEVGHPSSLMIASLGIGLLSLRQGNLSRALPALERAMDICHEADLSTFFPWMAAALGAAYTLGGRVADAVPLLTQALEQTTATEMVRYQALCSLCLGEAQMLAGHLEEAYTLAEQTLGFTRAHQEGGHQAYALRLLGDIATQCEPPASDQAEVYYQQALVLAEALGMRPLVAHCHHRLGQLYHQIGRDEQARTALTTAIDFYRAMEMTFWLPQAKAVLAQVEE